MKIILKSKMSDFNKINMGIKRIMTNTNKMTSELVSPGFVIQNMKIAASIIIFEILEITSSATLLIILISTIFGSSLLVSFSNLTELTSVIRVLRKKINAIIKNPIIPMDKTYKFSPIMSRKL